MTGIRPTRSSDPDAALERLNRLLAEAIRAPFYRERFKNVKLPLQSLEEFSHLPVLEKNELVQHAPPKSDAMLTRDPHNSYLFSAGGTTGEPVFLYWSVDEHRESCAVLGAALRSCGIGPGDVAANCFRAGAFWTGFLVTNAGLEEIGCTVLSITGNHTADETLDYLELFRPTVLLGIPGFLVELARKSRDRGNGLRIDRVFYAGTHMPDVSRDLIRETWGCSHVGSQCYAAVEVGPIGYQCPYCSAGEHHVLEEWCYVESLPDGNILVTPLHRYLQPVIRSRVGDLIEWVDGPCPCGSSAPKFRLKARSDDLIRLSGNAFRASEVGRVLAMFPQLTEAYQIVIDPAADGLYLKIRVETDGDEALSDKETATLIDLLGKEIDCLGALREENTIRQISLECLPPGGIGRVARTGKMRRVVDNRA